MWNTPSKGCSKKGRVDKYGDTYGTAREFNRKEGSFEDNTKFVLLLIISIATAFATVSNKSISFNMNNKIDYKEK